MTSSTASSAERELIVLAASRPGDPYYADIADKIFEFHVAFAKQAEPYDDLIVLVGEGMAAKYAAAIGKDRILVAPMTDIWTRDFGASNPADTLMFRYTAEGQGGGRKGQRDADAVQDDMAELLETAGVTFGSSDLLNDGGNWVEDGQGRAILSRKFLRDNNLEEAEGRARLQRETRIQHVAFIEADEQGGLEHADGVVAFVEPNVVIVNAYPEDPAYAAALKADLRSGLPGVAIHEIITPYDATDIYDERFGSACGLYTNMLVTPSRIYLPQFGIPEDTAALAQVQALTDKTVVPVQSAGVCQMGGGVRCMSFQLRGEAADRMRAYIAANP